LAATIYGMTTNSTGTKADVERTSNVVSEASVHPDPTGPAHSPSGPTSPELRPR